MKLIRYMVCTVILHTHIQYIAYNYICVTEFNGAYELYEPQVCMHTHTHNGTHVHTYTHTHTRTHNVTHIHTHARAHTHTRTHTL